jgi:hypothetical protein
MAVLILEVLPPSQSLAGKHRRWRCTVKQQQMLWAMIGSKASNRSSNIDCSHRKCVTIRLPSARLFMRTSSELWIQHRDAQQGISNLIFAGLPVATRLFASARAQVRCQKSTWRDHLLSVAVSVAAVPVNHPRDHEYAPYRHAPDNPGCCRTRSDARSTPAPKQ